MPPRAAALVPSHRAGRRSLCWHARPCPHTSENGLASQCGQRGTAGGGSAGGREWAHRMCCSPWRGERTALCPPPSRSGFARPGPVSSLPRAPSRPTRRGDRRSAALVSATTALWAALAGSTRKEAAGGCDSCMRGCCNPLPRSTPTRRPRPRATPPLALRRPAPARADAGTGEYPARNALTRSSPRCVPAAFVRGVRGDRSSRSWSRGLRNVGVASSARCAWLPVGCCR